jgi:DNA-binding MarR family transcriptional regulator
MSRRGHLDEHVPYLLNRAGGRYALAFAQALRKTSVRFTSWRVLNTLWHQGPLQLTDLANSANFDLSTLSRVVAGLEEDGLLQRLAPAARGQRRPVVLSAAGERLVESLAPLDTKLEGQLIANLSAHERAMLIQLLHKLDYNLSDESESAVNVS